MTELSDNIASLYDKGLSYRQIQAQLGCSKGTISYHLGVGQKDKSRHRQRDRRGSIKKYIQDFKQGKRCLDCREEYPNFVLDFDHLGDKSFAISQFWAHTSDIELVKREIEKCELVCANCHRIRTFARNANVSGNSLDLITFYSSE